MIIDWNAGGFDDSPCNYLGLCKHVDALTGEDVPMVCYYDTKSHLVKRYRTNDDGDVAIDPSTGRVDVIQETRQLILIQLSSPRSEMLEAALGSK